MLAEADFSIEIAANVFSMTTEIVSFLWPLRKNESGVTDVA